MNVQSDDIYRAPIYIAMGANLSNPKVTFAKALKVLAAYGVSSVRVSALWQSPAWPPGSDQPDYVNACAQVDFSGDARALLTILHEVEAEFGRVRGERNAARTLDLDLLDFKRQVIRRADIDIPHPRMLSRGFVLFPLQDIAPDWRDPVSDDSIENHIARLPLGDVAPMRRLGRF